MYRCTIAFCLFVVLGLSAPAVVAQGFQRQQDDNYPLGGIEAQGDVLLGGKGKCAIVVKEVFDGGLAKKGGLLSGDRIVKAGGRKLTGKSPNEVIDQFCALVEKAEAKKAQGKWGLLKVTVERGGRTVKLNLPVRPLGPFSKSQPEKCRKTAKVLADALKFLAKRQTSTGRQQLSSNNNHAVATASLCGLAWLGSGRKKYAGNIAKAADFVMKQAGVETFPGQRKPGGPNWNQTNWSLSYALIFLSEYYAGRRKPAVKKRLQELADRLLANQEASGGWAHGPGGPNALNYLELEIMSNLALGGLGMAGRVGIRLDEARMARGYQYVKACTSGGGVAYSPRPGQKGVGDPGRTAGALWALKQIGRGKELQGSMAKYYTRGMADLYEGHACPTMHILNGALASALLGRKHYVRYFKLWRPFIMASRTHDGAFGCRPNGESRQMKHHTDRGWGPSFVTAHYALALMLAQDRFKLLDRLEQGRS